MEIELLMRRERKVEMSEEDREEYKIQRLLPKFDEDEWAESHKEEKEYDYVPVTIDIRDAMPYSQHDGKHTHIFLRSGLAFIAKIDYDVFQGIRMAMLGTMVKKVEDFNFEMVVPAPEPKTKTKK
jgi:hypothetical protein